MTHRGESVTGVRYQKTGFADRSVTNCDALYEPRSTHFFRKKASDLLQKTWSQTHSNASFVLSPSSLVQHQLHERRNKRTRHRKPNPNLRNDWDKVTEIKDEMGNGTLEREGMRFWGDGDQEREGVCGAFFSRETMPLKRSTFDQRTRTIIGSDWLSSRICRKVILGRGFMRRVVLWAHGPKYFSNFFFSFLLFLQRYK